MTTEYGSRSKLRRGLTWADTALPPPRDTEQDTQLLSSWCPESEMDMMPELLLDWTAVRTEEPVPAQGFWLLGTQGHALRPV